MLAVAYDGHRSVVVGHSIREEGEGDACIVIEQIPSSQSDNGVSVAGVCIVFQRQQGRYLPGSVVLRTTNIRGDAARSLDSEQSSREAIASQSAPSAVTAQVSSIEAPFDAKTAKRDAKKSIPRPVLPSTSAGIAAASAAVASNLQPFANTSAEGASPMQEPYDSQDPQLSSDSPTEPQVGEQLEPNTTLDQTSASQPAQQPYQPSSTDPAIAQPPNVYASKTTANTEDIDLTLPASNTEQERYEQEVYAPTYAAPPESKSSPLMWVWLLFTGLLAVLVAWGWIGYFNSPAPSSDRETIEPAPSDEPELRLPEQ